MKKLAIIQWGKERSIVKEFYPDTKEETYYIIDNQHLMILDERGMIL